MSSKEYLRDRMMDALLRGDAGAFNKARTEAGETAALAYDEICVERVTLEGFAFHNMAICEIKFQGVSFIGATFDGSEFRNCTFDRCTFGRSFDASLYTSSFRRCTFKNVKLARVGLCDCTFNNGTRFLECSFYRLKNAHGCTWEGVFVDSEKERDRLRRLMSAGIRLPPKKRLRNKKK